MKSKYIFIAIVSALFAGLGIGYFIFHEDKGEHTHQVKSENGQTWTCSMHPQIKKSEPGKCPICGMDLVPQSDVSDNMDPEAVQLSSSAVALANIQTEKVTKGKPEQKIRLSGKIAVNENEIYTQAFHFPGRIEKSYINFKGEKVSKGQIIAYLYSPEIVAAQDEYLELLKGNPNNELLKAARQKLENWKISTEMVSEIEKRGEPIEKFPIKSEVDGIVLEKLKGVGDYVSKGASFFKVANIQSVWALLDVYERDLPFVKEGDKVKVNTQAFPEITFSGIIDFVDPVIDAKDRVAKARVALQNRQEKLKPQMLISAETENKGKYTEDQIMVPASAVLWTGELSIVYVKTNSSKGVAFKLRKVKLGPLMNERYVILAGLKEGEEIAVNGTFSIDAAAQLTGKPSMMQVEDKKKELSSKDQESFDKIINTYLELKSFLVQDEYSKSKESWKKLHELLMDDKGGDSFKSFKSSTMSVLHSQNDLANIKMIRKGFEELSKQIVKGLKTFGNTSDTYYIQKCPMANDNQGAVWVSEDKEIRNPYFGESMLKCGSVIDVINF